VSGKTRHDNPAVLLSRVAIYWIGGLLGLVVLAGCKSDRLNERVQPFSEVSMNLIVR
jgi:hypothetical protein